MTVRPRSCSSKAPCGAASRYTTLRRRLGTSRAAGMPSSPTVGRASGAGGSRVTSTRPRMEPAAARAGRGVAAPAATARASIGSRAIFIPSLEPQHELADGQSQLLDPAAVPPVALVAHLGQRVAEGRVAGAGLPAPHGRVPRHGPAGAVDTAEAQVVDPGRAVEAGHELAAYLAGEAQRLERSGERGRIPPAPDRLRAHDPAVAGVLEVGPPGLLKAASTPTLGKRLPDAAGEVLASGPRSAEDEAGHRLPHRADRELLAGVVVADAWARERPLGERRARLHR